MCPLLTLPEVYPQCGVGIILFVDLQGLQVDLYAMLLPLFEGFLSPRYYMIYMNICNLQWRVS